MNAAVVALVCVASLTGCASRMPSAPSGPVDAQIVLAPGQVKDVPDAGIRIRFQSVTGDSRCPADAVCIQGGDAVVHIDVLPASGGTFPYELHTGTQAPVMHGDLTIELEMLEPYPFSGKTIAQSDYRATLRVTR